MIPLPFPRRIPCTVALALCGLVGGPATAAEPFPRGTPEMPEREASTSPVPATPVPSDLATIWPDSPVIAESLPPGLRADNLLGQKVLGTDSVELGTLRDLVIDVEKGEIEYAVVGTGGFLGVGETRRLVPASALAGPIPLSDDGHPMIPLDKEAWQQAPSFKGDPLATLSDPDRRRQIDRHFRDAIGPSAVPEDKAASADATPANQEEQWKLAQDLHRTEVRSGDLTIGKVETILVDLNHLGALVRLSPRVAALGTSRPFIVRFDQLSVASDDALTTSLTAEDFRRVLPELTGTIPGPPKS